MLRSLLIVVVLFSSLSTGLAQDANQVLAWKFAAGDVFYMQEKMRQQQTVKTGGNTQKKDSTQTTITSFEVLDANASDVTLRMTMLSVKESGTNGGSNQEILDRMKGSEFEITLTNKGEITKFTGYEGFVERISQGNAALARVFRSILSEESFRKMVTQTFTIVPNKPTRQGEEWKQSQDMSLGPFGNVKIVRNIKHAGHAANTPENVKLDLVGDAKYEAPTSQFPGFPFKISGGKLKFDDISGEGEFDPKAGRLRRLEVHLKMSGTLTMQIGNNSEADVDLDQTQRGIVVITNTNPLEKT